MHADASNVTRVVRVNQIVISNEMRAIFILRDLVIFKF